jgi:hypothetical protein
MDKAENKKRQALGVVGGLLVPFLVLLRGHNSRGLPAVRCVSAGAERRGDVLCVAPAYVVSPRKKRKKKEDINTFFRTLWRLSC